MRTIILVLSFLGVLLFIGGIVSAFRFGMPYFIKYLIYLGSVLFIGVLIAVFRHWWKEHKYERTKTEDLLENLSYRVTTVKQIREIMVEYLASIGVSAQQQDGQTGWVRQDKVESAWGSQKLALVQVSLRQIHSIEMWRQSWQASVRHGLLATENQGRSAVELVYVMTLDPEIVIPPALHTNTITEWTLRGKIKSLEWHGFPGLRDKLEADKRLKSGIIGSLRKSCEFSVRRLPNGSVGIATDLVLPSREMLRCIEDVAVHVSNYVSEWNRDKQKSNE